MLREFSIGSYKHMKSDKEEFTSSMTDIDDISSKWKPSEGINWDLIQRMRFMNADAEIDPEDTYSEEAKKDIDE